MYFQDLLQISLDSAAKDIQQIWKDINTGASRPSQIQNDWVNFIWWLNKNIPQHSFSLFKTKDEIKATEFIINCINEDFPILISTNHTKTKGHIILAVGYINYVPNQSSADFNIICHDPYGAFSPILLSNLYGKKRYDTGMSNADGSEEGIGKGVGLTITSIKRNRNDLHTFGEYVMISCNN